MKTRFSNLMVLLVCPLVSFPATAAEPAPTVRVDGVVIDAAVSPPGAAKLAIVVLRDTTGQQLTAATDNAGRYAFEKVAPGAITLGVLAAQRQCDERKETVAAPTHTAERLILEPLDIQPEWLGNFGKWLATNYRSDPAGIKQIISTYSRRGFPLEGQAAFAKGVERGGAPEALESFPDLKAIKDIQPEKLRVIQRGFELANPPELLAYPPATRDALQRFQSQINAQANAASDR
jgi:hypothetical protein